LIVWAATLAIAAAIDAKTQRVPTGVVRTGGIFTAAALVAAGLATHDYRSLAAALVAVIVSAVVLALCWRFAGVGWGDVRLAAAGGLGMGHATRSGITTGIAVFVVITFVQAVYTYAKTRDRKAHFPLGPALAAGFLAAAAA
jgi:leader peptidase (prepilin peptidase)/N-methyltransferase